MPGESPRSPNVTWHDSGVARAERIARTGSSGATVWLTGLSGSGKSTIAVALLERLSGRGVLTYVLDGDNLRHGLNGDLGFSDADRAENVRRVGEVARLFADAGLIAIAPVISPFRAGRDQVRATHDQSGLCFLEVFADAPLEVCEARDPKGLYARARAGELRGLTGVDDPYEAPGRPDVTVSTGTTSPDEAATAILEALVARGVVPRS
jgi:bifunctional enzyme CysN/CysC